MNNLTLIKLGGSLITDKNKPFVEKRSAISRLAKEIKSAQERSGELILVGHGGGSYPHVPAKKFRTAEGIINDSSYEGISKVQDAASRLNRIVVEMFIKNKLNAVSLPPSAFMVSDGGKPKKGFIDPFLHLLKHKMLPVTYGDISFDEKMGVCIASTEKVLGFLAKRLAEANKITKIIYCGITNGVYDEKGTTIPTINSSNFKDVKKKIGGSVGIDVTGGMIHKVEEGLRLAKDLNVSILIINGAKKDNLKKAVLGSKVKATTILP